MAVVWVIMVAECRVVMVAECLVVWEAWVVVMVGNRACLHCLIDVSSGKPFIPWQVIARRIDKYLSNCSMSRRMRFG